MEEYEVECYIGSKRFEEAFADDEEFIEWKLKMETLALEQYYNGEITVEVVT